jgi:maltose/maltodextrin transport system permease protein
MQSANLTASNSSAPVMIRPSQASPWPTRIVGGLAFVSLLWLCFSLITAGQAVTAVGVAVLGGLTLYVYAVSNTVAWKYLFPGVMGMLLFIALPLLYTVQIGFTNYSSNNLLSQDRARAYLLEQTLVDPASLTPFRLYAVDGGHRILLDQDSGPLVSAVIKLGGPSSPVPLAVGAAPTGTPLDVRALIPLRAGLQPLVLALPDGSTLRYAGLREFGKVTQLWTPEADGALRSADSGEIYRPNLTSGFFENARGERIQPGFTVGIGFANYSRMLFDADFRGPFVSIFIWTVIFAGLTVLFSAGLGMTLAVLLNWEALRFRTLYRTLLFLPYAVPGFISILVFKGLFNQNFGEINAILNALFGIRPAWFADPFLAKVMLITVNVWLGFPYFMVLCTGLIKAIPADLYEASALAGAGPLTNFFRITAPLIARPLTPLLIAAFAFNFNNFVLIALLTEGRPDFLNTKIPAGTNDILVSYTYRIAFTDSGQNFGLAAAISTIIFIMVAIMALIQLKLSHKEKR